MAYHGLISFNRLFGGGWERSPDFGRRQASNETQGGGCHMGTLHRGDCGEGMDAMKVSLYSETPTVWIDYWSNVIVVITTYSV
jgi:hypothetical protein